MKFFKRSLLLSALLTLSLSHLQAQTVPVPHFINFQSVLRDDSGNLITNSTIDLEFRVLDQDGTELYHETQSGVQVVRSSVNVLIGEGIVPGSSPAQPTGGIPTTALDPSTGSKFIEMKVGSNKPSEPMELSSVPYAMFAERALGLSPNIQPSDLPPIIATDTEVNTLIQQEVTDRTNADTTLQNNITAETNTRAAADTDLQNQITNEASTRANADTNLQNQINTLTTSNTTLQNQIDGKVSKSGDTMTGDLTMNANIVMQNGRTVDGVDVSALNTEVQSQNASIKFLLGTDFTLPFNNITGQISPNQVPQFMRPFAFGSFNGSTLTAAHNIANVTCAGAFISCQVNFSTSAGTIDYVVMLTPSGTSPSIGASAGTKTASGFTIKPENNSVGFDILVFKP